MCGLTAAASAGKALWSFGGFENSFCLLIVSYSTVCFVEVGIVLGEVMRSDRAGPQEIGVRISGTGSNVLLCKRRPRQHVHNEKSTLDYSMSGGSRLLCEAINALDKITCVKLIDRVVGVKYPTCRY